MRNIINITANPRIVKHARILRIAGITDYNGDTKMPSTRPQPVGQTALKQKGRSQQAKLNAVEEQRLHNIAVRFQKVVVDRNARLGENSRGDVKNPELVHAGLIALEQVKSDDDFYRLIVDGKNRR